LIEATARRHRVDPALLMAMAAVESNFDPFAVSSKGACGILQLIPATAERFGVVDVFDARENLNGGAGYLRWLLDRFEGETELALAAYNAGENAVDRYGGIPPYPETRDYVRRVLSRRTAALGPLQASE
jgi:soluble lytic murein transglycosylase-like protein